MTALVLQQNRLRWYGHVLRKEDDDWVKKCMEYEVEGQYYRCKCRKMIKGVRWSGWVWVGECFFWYRPNRVVPYQRPLNGCVCCGNLCVHHAHTHDCVGSHQVDCQTDCVSEWLELRYLSWLMQRNWYWQELNSTIYLGVEGMLTKLVQYSCMGWDSKKLLVRRKQNTRSLWRKMLKFVYYFRKHKLTEKTYIHTHMPINKYSIRI